MYSIIDRLLSCNSSVNDLEFVQRIQVNKFAVPFNSGKISGNTIVRVIIMNKISLFFVRHSANEIRTMNI